MEDQITTLTPRSASSITQFSEANCGWLVAEDRVDILEEGGSHNPIWVPSTLAGICTESQVKNPPYTKGWGATRAKNHILGIDGPRLSPK